MRVSSARYGRTRGPLCERDGHRSRRALRFDVAQLRYSEPNMKSATIPSVRVEPELRAEVESLLSEGETVSEFVEASVRATVLRRRQQAEFIARRRAAIARTARQTDDLRGRCGAGGSAAQAGRGALAEAGETALTFGSVLPARRRTTSRRLFDDVLERELARPRGDLELAEARACSHPRRCRNIENLAVHLSKGQRVRSSASY